MSFGDFTVVCSSLPYLAWKCCLQPNLECKTSFTLHKMEHFAFTVSILCGRTHKVQSPECGLAWDCVSERNRAI